MNESIYQYIFDKIQELLPPNWEKMIFFAGYAEGSYSMKFYTDCGEGKIIDCFNISNLDRMKLIKAFSSIDVILSAERKKIAGDKRWTVLTMIVDAKGNMKTEFDYTDISEDFIGYERKWERKYL